MKRNKFTSISKLGKWLPGKRTQKIERTLHVAIPVLAGLFAVPGVWLSYPLWAEGRAHTAIQLIGLIFCFLCALGLLLFRGRIEAWLLPRIIRGSAAFRKQAAKQLTHTGINRGKAWVSKNLKLNFDAARDRKEEDQTRKESTLTTRKQVNSLFKPVPQPNSPTTSSEIASAIPYGAPKTAVGQPATLCPVCGRPQRIEARFCDGCGAVLPFPCPHCGHMLRGGAKFCDHCGQSIARS